MNSEFMASRLITPSLLASIWAKASCTNGREEGLEGLVRKSESIHPSESKFYRAQHILGCPTAYIHGLSQVIQLYPQSITPNFVPTIYVHITICISQISYRSNQEIRSTAPSTATVRCCHGLNHWAPSCCTHQSGTRKQLPDMALLCCPMSLLFSQHPGSL